MTFIFYIVLVGADAELRSIHMTRKEARESIAAAEYPYPAATIKIRRARGAVLAS